MVHLKLACTCLLNVLMMSPVVFLGHGSGSEEAHFLVLRMVMIRILVSIGYNFTHGLSDLQLLSKWYNILILFDFSWYSVGLSLLVWMKID